MKTISCIIPAYNESTRIAAVLATIQQIEEISEVIVVDDGSSDATAEVASRFNVTVIVLPHNHGKSFALATGIQASTGDYLLFLDADLKGVTPGSIARLLEPVVQGVADASFSIRGNVPFFYKHLGIDPLTGERFVPRDLLSAHIQEIKNLRSFGVEVFMNSLIVAQRMRISVVAWPEVKSPYKYWKTNLFIGLWGDVKMVRDIFSVITVKEFIAQVRELKKRMRFLDIPLRKYDISILVPAFNEAKYIDTCLTHIIAARAHTDARVEVIVVDNASTDRTTQRARTYPDIEVVREERKGLTRARQRGLNAARAPIVAYVDADTSMPKGWIEDIYQAFMRDPSMVYLSGPYVYLEETFGKRIFWWLYWHSLAYPAYLLFGYFAVGGNFAARKESIESIGGFDTTIAFYGEDTDIARRLTRVGKTRFKLSLTMPTSPRRFEGQGFVRSCILYAVNYLAIAAGRRPISTNYLDIR